MIMIVVYPIGISLMYLWLLYAKRKEIMERDELAVAPEDNMEHKGSTGNGR